EIQVREVGITGESIYADRHQCVVHPQDVQEIKIHEMGAFLARHCDQTVRHRAVIYLSRDRDVNDELLVVCRGSTANIEIPSIAFDLEEPQKEATARCLREQCGLSALLPQKIGVQYDY